MALPSPKVRIGLRISPALKERLDALAFRQSQTRCSLVCILLHQALLLPSSLHAEPSMTSPSLRRRIVITLTLVPELLKRVDEKARAMGMPRAAFIIMALTHFLDHTPAPGESS